MSLTISRVSLYLVVILLATVNAFGQTPPAEEVLIKNYREEIRLLTLKQPQAEALVDAHRRTLLTIRQKLRDLLLQKVGGLKKDIRDYNTSGQPSAELQTYIQKLQENLKEVESEIQGLGDSSALSLLRPDAAPDVTSVAPPAAAPSPLKSESQAEFEAVVKSFTSEKLEAAAAPPELMEDKGPQINCVALLNDADPSRFSKYDQAVCFLAEKVNDRKGANTEAGIDLREDKGNLLTVLIAKLLKTKGSESLVSFITEAQDARIDQQIGSDPGSSGTTSLVSKGGVPYALGFAVENGAAVQTKSGTTATFRINPAGTLSLFAKKGFITGFQETENDPVLKFLRKSSIGLSFDTSRGAEPGTFTGDRQQLSAVSYRYEFVNERDPRHKKYEVEWEKLVATVGEEFARTTWATTRALQNFGTKGQLLPKLKDPALQAWLDETNGKLAAAGGNVESIAAVIRSEADRVPGELVAEDTVEAITAFAKGFEAYEREKNRLLDRIARGKILTFEYINRREVNAADTSNFNFIAATGTANRVSLTANGSLTLFNKRPLQVSLTSAHANRVRDFQFAGELAVPFKFGKGQFDFWFSGRYERLLDDATTLAGTTMPGTRGDIAVGQFGLNIPIPGLGIKFPVSFTFANRTELVKEKEIRGNFGFTFNWDTLFSKIKPF